MVVSCCIDARNFHATIIEGLLFLCPSFSVPVTAVVDIENLASKFVLRLHPIYGVSSLLAAVCIRFPRKTWLEYWLVGWLVCGLSEEEKIMICG